MAAENSQQLFCDERFLERHAGSIIVDPSVAIVELVSNAWDALATHVDNVWPESGSSVEFSIGPHPMLGETNG